jgi:hypothetical protein
VSRHLDQHWSIDAACGGTDPNMWVTPSKADGVEKVARMAVARQALLICASCPVRRQCAADADEYRPKGLIQGGRVYDEAGHPYPDCRVCHRPILSGDCRSVTCEQHTLYQARRLAGAAA